jgi:hypothetical protein
MEESARFGRQNEQGFKNRNEVAPASTEEVLK